MYKNIFIWMMLFCTACLFAGCGNQYFVGTNLRETGDDSGEDKQQKQSEIPGNADISWESGRILADASINST